MITLPKLMAISWFIFLSIVAFYIYYPYEVVDMKSLPLPVDKKQVKAGETINILMDFDKKINCRPEIRWFLVDGFVLPLSESSVRRSLGDQTLIREIHIPESASKGVMSHIRIEYSCRVNALRVIEYSWDSEEFEVI